jgi:hypothetical protein
MDSLVNIFPDTFLVKIIPPLGDTIHDTVKITAVHHLQLYYYLSLFLNFLNNCKWPILILLLLIFHKFWLGPSKTFLMSILQYIHNIKVGSFELTTRSGTVKVNAESKFEVDSKCESEMLPISLVTDSLQKQIIALLWKGQTDINDSTYQKRWSFTITPNDPRFPSFLGAAQNLMKLGLVAQDLGNRQIFLTDFGVKYCKKHSGALGSPLDIVFMN